MTKIMLWLMVLLISLGCHQGLRERRPDLKESDLLLASITWPFVLGMKLATGDDHD